MTLKVRFLMEENAGKVTLTVGTRESRLAQIQSQAAVDAITELVPCLELKLITMSSPGDIDRTTDLRVSRSDFFTQFLDEAVLDGTVDCAIHSAKDMPDTIADGVSWVWLPWREDPRDCLVSRLGESLDSLSRPVVGISSDRRADYCQRRFVEPVLEPIRGNVDDRLAQLDGGRFDVIVTAVAALNRLGMADRITEYISAEELPAPDGQGCLALTFRTDDRRLRALRELFVKPVILVGVGPGESELCTIGGAEALRNCDVCLYDALASPDLLRLLPEHAQAVDVGKRGGHYTVSRSEMQRLTLMYACRGARVVRLKGGDPGIFGRLAEEVDALVTEGLPFRVLPGVSSLQASTTGTGMLLTRRGVSHGFCASTPRLAGGTSAAIAADVREQMTLAFFMAVGRTAEIRDQLLSEGRAESQPAVMVYGAGTIDQRVVHSTLGEIADAIADVTTEQPGLLLVGETADKAFTYPSALGALAGRQVLLTCSAELQRRASMVVRDWGGMPIAFPLIATDAVPSAVDQLQRINDFDWVVLTSPSAVRALMALMASSNVDIRRIPRILGCGPGVERTLNEYGLYSEVVPLTDFGANGMLAAAADCVGRGERVLRCRSSLAGPRVADELSRFGALVTDCVLYANSPVRYDRLPSFDAVFFASGSAVDGFVAQWGTGALAGRDVVAIGEPTARSLREHGRCPDVVSSVATVDASLSQLAVHYVMRRLQELAVQAVNVVAR